MSVSIDAWSTDDEQITDLDTTCFNVVWKFTELQ